MGYKSAQGGTGVCSKFVTGDRQISSSYSNCLTQMCASQNAWGQDIYSILNGISSDNYINDMFAEHTILYHEESY
jgi:hypothetical protein